MLQRPSFLFFLALLGCGMTTQLIDSFSTTATTTTMSWRQQQSRAYSNKNNNYYHQNHFRRNGRPLAMATAQQPGDEEGRVWLPRLRQVMGGIATLGATETAYLTYQKLLGDGTTTVFCGVDGGGDCNQVLTGPYSNLPFTDVPLAAVGFVAYATVACLALYPLLFGSGKDDNEIDDTNNRVALTALTTAMGTFSIFLMSLLFGVLQTTCPYCVFSAICSIVLAKLAWIGGCLPEGSKMGAKAAGSSFLATTLASLALFFVNDDIGAWNFGGSSAATATTTLLASSSTNLYSPPPITTESSKRAMKLANDLQALDAKMYGAYWCSHCYDQKEVFGKQAFSKISYVECSKDGVNSQTKLCKANEVPGYPTWQIQGKLYPGQQELDELEELVKTIQSPSSSLGK